MPYRFPPISLKFPHFLHGGDYNPDQWPAAVWREDMRLMRLAHCNAMTVGVFAWASLEPEEGRFTSDWLDRIMDMLAGNGAYAVLATPTAAARLWLGQKCPETLRGDGEHDYLFLLNFTSAGHPLALGDQVMTDMVSGASMRGALDIGPYGSPILTRPRRA